MPHSSCLLPSRLIRQHSSSSACATFSSSLFYVAGFFLPCLMPDAYTLFSYSSSCCLIYALLNFVYKATCCPKSMLLLSAKEAAIVALVAQLCIFVYFCKAWECLWFLNIYHKKKKTPCKESCSNNSCHSCCCRWCRCCRWCCICNWAINAKANCH